MNILFLGNSYTFFNDMPKIFEKLACGNGREVKTFSVTEGGINLYKFTDGKAEVSKELSKLLIEQKFDVCFMQDHSLVPVQNSGLFISGVVLVYRKIKDIIPNIYLYETWGRKRISEENSDVWSVDEGMTKGLLRIYGDASDMLGIKLSTVGESFYKLHNADPSIELYEEDCSHPSYKGSCLAALTHYYTAFGEFPENTASLNLSDDEIRAFKAVICE